MTRLVQLVLVMLCVLVTWPALAGRTPEDRTSPVDTTRPSHGRPQRSEDGRLGGAGRAQAEGRARNRVGIPTHDALGNLAAATYADGKVDLRMPDAVGNLFRTSDRSDRKYGRAGELLESRDGCGVTRYEYDPEGNLIKKTEPDGATWLYRWNGAGLLSEVTRPDGHVVSFTYDALARRLSKTYRGKTTKWIWDGNVPLHEWVERSEDAVDQDFTQARQQDAVAVGERNLKALLSGRPANGPPPSEASAASLDMASAEGSVESPVTWLFEPESFAPLAKIVDGERFGIVTDHLGTPRAMFDGVGAEVWGADVDAYGDLRNLRGERQACPFRWPGQYEDEETGLYYNRWRYYDHCVGSYCSTDRIGIAGGLSVYAYVRSPTQAADVLGLSECVPAKGEPLPEDAVVHRIGGASTSGLSMKPGEVKLSPPGISLLRAETPELASELAKDVAAKKGWSRMADAAETMGTASVGDIRGAGFDVIHDPTDTWGQAHARLVHPEGAAGFTPANLEKLASVFSNKTGL